MTIVEALLLGFIQGATEFLPVSSSGHLVLVPNILGLPDPSLNAVVIAHMGTLLAVLIYFARDLSQVWREVWRGLALRQPFGTPEARLGWYIALGTAPAALVGYLFEERFDALFAAPAWAAAFLLVTAAFLTLGEKLLSGRKNVDSMSWLDALIIGIFQMFALMPGLSRSGSTITAGLLRQLDRQSAARFSFLLSVPIILGTGLFQVQEMATGERLAGEVPLLLLTFVVSFVVGYASIHYLLAWLRQRSLIPFAIYCAAFGGLYLLITSLTA